MDRVITIAVSIAAASSRYGARRVWRQPRPSEDIRSTALTPRQAAGIRQAAQAGKDIGKDGYRTKTRAKSHANHQHDQCLAGDGYRAWRDHHLELRRSQTRRKFVAWVKYVPWTLEPGPKLPPTPSRSRENLQVAHRREAKKLPQTRHKIRF